MWAQGQAEVDSELVKTGPEWREDDVGGTNLRKGVGLLPTGHFPSRYSLALTREGGRDSELEELH